MRARGIEGEKKKVIKKRESQKQTLIFRTKHPDMIVKMSHNIYSQFIRSSTRHRSFLRLLVQSSSAYGSETQSQRNQVSFSSFSRKYLKQSNGCLVPKMQFSNKKTMKCNLYSSQSTISLFWSQFCCYLSRGSVDQYPPEMIWSGAIASEYTRGKPFGDRKSNWLFYWLKC